MPRARLFPVIFLLAPLLGGAGACDCGGGGSTIPDAGPGKCQADVECVTDQYCSGIGFCAPFNPDSDARGCLRTLSQPCVGGTVCSNAARACVPICGATSTGSADAGTCVLMCQRDTDCRNHVYCDGFELCQPGDPRADARGCMPAAPLSPCTPGQLCDEAGQRCTSMQIDNDGDGHTIEYDCDDNDPQRYPGATELCDGDDEDCDDTTVGDRDIDGDGYVDGVCRNGTNWGDDCDDNDGAQHPNQPEVCNGVDDDCDNLIDEGISVPLYIDLDRDGFGAGGPDAGCPGAAGLSALGNDCDDTNPAINPGALVCTPGTTQNYTLCTSAGAWLGGKCNLQLTCHVQPNGTGFCL